MKYIMAAKKKLIETKTKEGMDSKSMCVLIHLSGIFLGFWVPLIAVLVANDETVKEHSKKALNWQITLGIAQILYTAFVFIVAIILMITIIGLILIPIFIIPLLIGGIINLAFCVMAAIKANEGTLWDYPLTYPFLK